MQTRNEIADVPVGVLLSGGLDSSLLVALLAEAGVSDLRTFSVGFEDHPDEKGSEFEYSDPVAQRYQTRHRKFLVPNSEVLQRLPEAVDAMAEPMFGQDAVAFYLLGEQVSKEVKVVQSGQGADEVFGGYFWYPRMLAETEGTPLQRFARHYFDRDHEEFLRTVSAQYRGEDYTSRRISELLAQPDADSFMDAVLRMDVTTLIVDDPVKRVDNMTMAWGLEARVPFLDHKLVELAARCPPELKLREGGKYPLKAMARGLLPDAVIDRPKGYFPMPALKYVRGDFLAFMRDILESRACRERGLYSRAYVNMLLSAPEMHHTRLQGSKLWHLALLEYWLQRNVDALCLNQVTDIRIYAMSIALTFHLLGAIVWVGGMFFAHMALRPAAAELLQPPLRLPLLKGVLDRFFRWVWVSIVAILASGYWIFLGLWKGHAGMHVHLMQGTGLLMVCLFLFIYFRPYRRMGSALAAGELPAAAAEMALIRRLIGINLILGLLTSVIAKLGPYIA